jgi:hypothetical protein
MNREAGDLRRSLPRARIRATRWAPTRPTRYALGKKQRDKLLIAGRAGRPQGAPLRNVVLCRGDPCGRPPSADWHPEVPDIAGCLASSSGPILTCRSPKGLNPYSSECLNDLGAFKRRVRSEHRASKLRVAIASICPITPKLFSSKRRKIKSRQKICRHFFSPRGVQTARALLPHSQRPPLHHSRRQPASRRPSIS